MKMMKMKVSFLKYILLILLLATVVSPSATYDRRTPIVEAVDKVLDSVVNISTIKDVRVNTFPSLFHTPFDDMFERTYRLEGLGSGIVVEGGYIITNNHVIEYQSGYADRILITFYKDTNQHEAIIYGVDPQADVAILRIQEPKDEVKYLPWAQSDDLMIGETVIAIGNALGHPFTVTNGIISALNREIKDDQGRRLTRLIQTNADINQGNSGGPLVNINGKFIGLNTAIITPSGGSVGLGFAIPSSRVKQVYDYWVNLIPRLEDRIGIEYQDLTPQLNHFFKSHYSELSDEHLYGIVILNVDPEQMGANYLKRGDIIYQIDGNKINESSDFTDHLEYHAGQQLSLSIIREGQKQILDISVPTQKVKTVNWQGMKIQELDTPWRRWYGLSARQHGLVVLSVEENSVAAKADIQRGDILLSADSKKLTSLDDLQQIRQTTRRKEDVVLTIYKRSKDSTQRIRMNVGTML